MAIAQKSSEEFEKLSKSIVEYILKDIDTNITLTNSHKDGGYDIDVECCVDGMMRHIYFECKLRSKNLNFRDIAANAIIAFNRNAVALVLMTNYNYTEQLDSNLCQFVNKTTLNIKVILGEEILGLIKNADIHMSKELQNIIGSKKNRLHNELSTLRLDFNKDSIYEQLICRKQFNAKHSQKYIVKLLQDKIENIQRELSQGYLVVISGFVGVGKYDFIQAILSTCLSQTITINANLHNVLENILLELLLKIWGIPEKKTLSILSDDDVENIIAMVGIKKNDEDLRLILSALLNSKLQKKRVNLQYNFLICTYIISLLKLHKDSVSYTFCIINLQYATKEIYSFITYFIKQLHESRIGCIIQYNDEEYKIPSEYILSNANDLERDLQNLLYYRIFKVNIFCEAQAIEYIKFIRKNISNVAALEIVRLVGVRLYNLSQVLKYLSNKDEKGIIKEIQSLTPNDISNLVDKLLSIDQEHYRAIFEVSYLLDFRVPLEICDMIGIKNKNLDKLVKKDFFRCEQGLVVPGNEFIRLWIKDAYMQDLPSLIKCASDLLARLETEESPYTEVKIKLHCYVRNYQDASYLLKSYIDILKRDKQYTILISELSRAIGIAIQTQDVDTEIDYLIQSLEILVIKKEISGNYAQSLIKRLAYYSTNMRTLPIHNIALDYFRVKLAYKIGSYSKEQVAVAASKIHYQNCLEDKVPNNEGDWLGRICCMYALFIKQSTGNTAAFQIFKNALAKLPNSFHLKCEYDSHVACMLLFSNPLKSYELYQNILKLFDNTPDSLALPFHEYGDIAMSQLIAGNLLYAQKLAEKALHIVSSNGVLDEVGRITNIRGCIELCKGNFNAAKISFRESSALMEHTDYLVYYWRSKLNYIQMQIETNDKNEDLKESFDTLYKNIHALLLVKIKHLAQINFNDFKQTREYHALLVLGKCYNVLYKSKKNIDKLIVDFNIQKHEKIYRKQLNAFINGELCHKDTPYLTGKYLYMVG